MKKLATKAIRTQIQQTNQKEHSTPMYLTSSFTFNTAEEMRMAFADESNDNIYSRFTNPNVQEFTDKMVALENAEAGFATATGMAAVNGTFMALLNSGDHLLCARSIFGNTHTVITKHLPRFNITHSFVNTNATLVQWQAAVQPNTKMLYIETPTNPGLDIVDLNLLAQFCKQNNILFVVDNCFATPFIQQPINFGADIVIHSATKWIDGQGRVLGGVVVGNKKLVNDIYLYCRVTGPTLSAFNAWVLSKSLETLEVRMERHAKTALHIAQKLQSHAAIEWLKYPFLNSHPQYKIAQAQMQSGGGIVCFSLKGGLAAGRKFLDALKMLTITANLGDTRSIATHPTTSTHSKLTEAEREQVGITPGLVRISVGLEHADDILADIEQALQSIL
jgi:O-succinylhomoserine sulfhydrylase